VIKGGTIYDGTLARPYFVDIGIQKDKIAAIGDLSGKAVKKSLRFYNLICSAWGLHGYGSPPGKEDQQ
jgi:hypothetical protein